MEIQDSEHGCERRLQDWETAGILSARGKRSQRYCKITGWKSGAAAGKGEARKRLWKDSELF